MSRKRYKWWPYVKAMINGSRQNSGETETDAKELLAVMNAVKSTTKMPDGKSRMEVVNASLIKCTHTVEGAALVANCSERTARRWRNDFIMETARNFGLLS